MEWFSIKQLSSFSIYGFNLENITAETLRRGVFIEYLFSAPLRLCGYTKNAELRRGVQVSDPAVGGTGSTEVD